MKCPKIPPKHTTNSDTNQISGYLNCVKLGIFLRTYQGPKPKGNISVPKMDQHLK